MHGALSREPAAEAARTQKTAPAPVSHGGGRPDVEKTILAYESDFWLQLAQASRSKIYLVSSKRIPAVYVSPTLAVSSITAAEELIRDRQKQELIEERAARRTAGGESDAQTPAGSEGPVNERDESSGSADDEAGSGGEASEEAPRLIAVDARLGIALFELSEAVEDPFLMVSPASLPPGSFLAAITVEADKRLRISPGYLVSTEKTGMADQDAESFEVSFELGEAPAMAAVVDLDGNLVGLAVRSPEGNRILSAPTVSRLVERMTEQPPCHSIEVSDLPAAAAKLLRLRNGVFVERVLDESFKPASSIHPGDVILRWAGEVVENAEQFHELYEAGSAGRLTRYLVQRGARRISGGTIMPGRDCRAVGEPPLSLVEMGVVLEWSERPADEPEDKAAGWRVIALIEEAPASESGLRLDDRILSANGREVTRRNGASTFSPFEQRGRSLALSVKRGDRVKLLAVSPDEVATP